MIYWLTIKFFFDEKILLYFFNDSSSFIKKGIYLVSSKPFLYALIFGSNIHRGLIFLAFLKPIKNLNPFLPKKTLLDTANILISIFFIEICSLCL